MVSRLLEQRMETSDQLLATLAERLEEVQVSDQQVLSEHADALLSQVHLDGLQMLSLTRAVAQDRQADLDVEFAGFEVAYVRPLVGNSKPLWERMPAQPSTGFSVADGDMESRADVNVGPISLFAASGQP